MNPIEPTEQRRDQPWRYWHTVLAFVAGVVASLFASLAVLVVTGAIDLQAGGETGVDISNAWLFWVIFPAQLFGSFIVLKWVSSTKGSGSFATDFGFEVKSSDWMWVPAGLALILVSATLTLILQTLFGVADQNAQDLVNIVAGEGAGITAFAMVAGIAVFGPIIEELTFRGLLMETILQRHSNTVAVVGSSAAFSLVHLVGLDPSGADGAMETLGVLLTPLIVLFAVGVVLAVVRIRTGSLSAPILLHSGFNLIQVLVLLFVPDLEI
jgi:membrane protease YdiL (CAAX protease family)